VLEKIPPRPPSILLAHDRLVPVPELMVRKPIMVADLTVSNMQQAVCDSHSFFKRVRRSGKMAGLIWLKIAKG
jgi:hypothetical protein